MNDTIGKTSWPHLVADLKAKRDALDQVITSLERTFIDDASPAVVATRNVAPRKVRTKFGKRALRRDRPTDRPTDRPSKGRASEPSSAEPP